MHPLDFIIVQEVANTLLGLPSCVKMGIIQQASEISERDELIETYSDVFEGLGLLPGKHTIHLKNDVCPVIHSTRKVPHRLREQLKAELDKMERDGIIQRVTAPTDWVSPLVLVMKKGGNIRICLDPSSLNEAIKREHYAIPTADEIFARLHGSAFFSTLDATSGFLQMQLDEESSYRTTFASPYGRFRYLRLPFGIKSAPEVFHRTVADLFSDIEGVETYVDDFLIHGSTEEEHDRRLRQVLERCRQVNLKLNLGKCEFKKTELQYLGHVISQNSLTSDQSKTKAICDMPEPQNKGDVRRILGMVTYLTKFCPNLSTIAVPLRDLTRKEVAWTLDTVHKDALAQIKALVSSTTVLKLFDPHSAVTLSVDASQYGLGACITQDGIPVAYASRTLTDTQKRYAQIEKELLAIQFGLERFHQYIYGQSVMVETDHLPLLGIMKKPIGDSSPRLQRMRLKCLYYDFQLVHRPGHELIIADTLSRAQLTEQYITDNLEIEQVHALTELRIPTELQRHNIRTLTRDDVTLQALITVLQTQWPPSKKLCHDSIKPFWNEKDNLMHYDGLVFKGQQLVIPSSLRPTVMHEIHSGHFGIVKCLDRAKTAVYWPGYMQQIRDMVESCSLCQENRRANSNMPLQQHQVPDYPYQIEGSDLFELDRQVYLLSVDYYSKWVFVEALQETRSIDVIRVLERQFVDFGVPERLVTDNGPQYGSSEFREFAKRMNFEHATSSPNYARSNGQSERHPLVFGLTSLTGLRVLTNNQRLRRLSGQRRPIGQRRLSGQRRPSGQRSLSGRRRMSGRPRIPGLHLLTESAEA